MKRSNMPSDNSTGCGSWLLRDCLHTRWNCTLFFSCLSFRIECQKKIRHKTEVGKLRRKKEKLVVKKGVREGGCPSGPRLYNQCQHYRKLARAVSRDKEGGFKCSQGWNNNWALILFFFLLNIFLFSWGDCIQAPPLSPSLSVQSWRIFKNVILQRELYPVLSGQNSITSKLVSDDIWSFKANSDKTLLLSFVFIFKPADGIRKGFMSENNRHVKLKGLCGFRGNKWREVSGFKRNLFKWAA